VKVAAFGKVKSLFKAPEEQKVVVESKIPIKSMQEIFPKIEKGDVTVSGTEIFDRHFYALPLLELLTLSAVCRHLKPKRIFEIGTYTGSSALIMAQNTPSDTKIFTLDLKPSEVAKVPNRSSGGSSQFVPGEAFAKHPLKRKIKQLYGDSRTFDFGPYEGKVDLVFIDANHSYPFVKNDSTQALKMLTRKGVILWDDYLFDPKHPECAGVSQTVQELALPNTYLPANTRFAIYLNGTRK